MMANLSIINILPNRVADIYKKNINDGQFINYFTPCSSVSIVTFGHVIVSESHFSKMFQSCG